MDHYTEDALGWLDRRFRETDGSGIYVAHQPIYGFRKGHSEPGTTLRYLITWNVMQALSHLRFGSLLDVGGAEGYKAALARELFDARVRSVDLSAEACRRAQAIFGVDGEPVDIHRLPYGDGDFDVVLCSETLEHVADLQSATYELLRVAAKAVVITVPHDPPALIERNIRDKVPHAHIHALDTRSFEFARPQVKSILCYRMLSPATKMLAVLAEGMERERIRNLPRGAVRLFNLSVPVSRAVFGPPAIASLLRLDGMLSRRIGPYGGMSFILLKDTAAYSRRPIRRISPRQVLDFAVPYHNPATATH